MTRKLYNHMKTTTKMIFEDG